MSRKSRKENNVLEAPVEPLQEQNVSKEDVGGDLCLSSDERLDLLLTEAKIKNAELIKRLKTYEFNTQISNIKNDFDNFMLDINKQQQSAQQYMLALREVIEKRLSIKLGEYAYDDLTGKLTKI